MKLRIDVNIDLSRATAALGIVAVLTVLLDEARGDIELRPATRRMLTGVLRIHDVDVDSFPEARRVDLIEQLIHALLDHAEKAHVEDGGELPEDAPYVH